MKVAVVKPDHLGDFVLSIPAISAISQRYTDTTLFVSSSTRALAAHLFPNLKLRTADLPHLAKFSNRSAMESLSRTDLNTFDFIYFLRRDHVLNADWSIILSHKSVLVEDRQDLHETRLQAQSVWQSGLKYDLPNSFAPGMTYPADPQKIGLCISAGFFANRWPTLRWIELGRKLRTKGVAVSIIGGPFEHEEAMVLAGSLRLDPSSVIIGSGDFAAFLQRIENLDLVVANDGGTAHICSLAAPVLSLFGGSPYRRYAPYGRQNRLLTRLLECSPCCQYHGSIVNGCVTIECLSEIKAETVFQAVFEPSGLIGEGRKLRCGGTLFFGLSHAHRIA